MGEQNPLTASKIEDDILVIKLMMVIFRDFVSNDGHFHMTFQQIWYSVWSGSNWPKSGFCSPPCGIVQFWNIVSNWLHIRQKCYFYVKSLIYGDRNARIQIKRQYLTLLLMLFTPKMIFIFHIFDSLHGGSRICSLFNLKYFTRNGNFDLSNCLCRVIRH